MAFVLVRQELRGSKVDGKYMSNMESRDQEADINGHLYCFSEELKY